MKTTKSKKTKKSISITLDIELYNYLMKNYSNISKLIEWSVYNEMKKVNSSDSDKLKKIII